MAKFQLSADTYHISDMGAYAPFLIPNVFQGVLIIMSPKTQKRCVIIRDINRQYIIDMVKLIHRGNESTIVLEQNEPRLASLVVTVGDNRLNTHLM